MNSIETSLFCGLIGVFLLVYKNTDKRLLYLISFFVLGIFISEILYADFGVLPGQVVWIISASGLFVSYIIRVWNRETKEFLDVLKVICVMLLILYPTPFYSLARDSDFWSVIRQLTFCILGIVYLYDRWILKPEKMKRKYLVIVIGQTIFILLLSMFAFIQHAAAERERLRTEKIAEDAVKIEKRLEEMEVKYREIKKENAR